MKTKHIFMTAAAMMMFSLPAMANSPVDYYPTMDNNYPGVVDHTRVMREGPMPDRDWDLRDIHGKREKLDLNKDGVVSREEWNRHIEWRKHRGMKHGMHKKHGMYKHKGRHVSTSVPPAHNEVMPDNHTEAGADGDGGWTAQ